MPKLIDTNIEYFWRMVTRLPLPQCIYILIVLLITTQFNFNTIRIAHIIIMFPLAKSSYLSVNEIIIILVIIVYFLTDTNFISNIAIYCNHQRPPVNILFTRLYNSVFFSSLIAVDSKTNLMNQEVILKVGSFNPMFHLTLLITESGLLATRQQVPSEYNETLPETERKLIKLSNSYRAADWMLQF